MYTICILLTSFAESVKISSRLQINNLRTHAPWNSENRRFRHRKTRDEKLRHASLVDLLAFARINHRSRIPSRDVQKAEPTPRTGPRQPAENESSPRHKLDNPSAESHIRNESLDLHKRGVEKSRRKSAFSENFRVPEHHHHHHHRCSRRPEAGWKKISDRVRRSSENTAVSHARARRSAAAAAMLAVCQDGAEPADNMAARAPATCVNSAKQTTHTLIARALWHGHVRANARHLQRCEP